MHRVWHLTPNCLSLSADHRSLLTSRATSETAQVAARRLLSPPFRSLGTIELCPSARAGLLQARGPVHCEGQALLRSPALFQVPDWVRRVPLDCWSHARGSSARQAGHGWGWVFAARSVAGGSAGGTQQLRCVRNGGPPEQVYECAALAVMPSVPRLPAHVLRPLWSCRQGGLNNGRSADRPAKSLHTLRTSVDLKYHREGASSSRARAYHTYWHCFLVSDCLPREHHPGMQRF